MSNSILARTAARPRRDARSWRPAALAVMLALAGAAHAQAQGDSMEDRLRNQLRNVTAQLQQAQNELAVLRAKAAQPQAPAAPPAELESLKKDLARAEARAAQERAARSQAEASNQDLRQQAQALVDKANAQLAQYRNAYDELLKMARASEAERQRLAAETTTQRTAITQCEAKNAQLYEVGQQILHAYETMDVGTVMAARQPFAARARVKYDEIAQKFGDQLYGGRFDERQAAQTAAQPAAAPAAQGGAGGSGGSGGSGAGTPPKAN
ncbi:hypothetical protein GCM10023144_01980 [Pigmentiphaga soli]|uniref:DNA repair protein n=1 Tax=Pigmentiphaga soli TaxID=1007095 RepID=A0ABP8GD67_9BURK